MIIVDTALKKRHDEGRPINVGIIGAGYMGRGVTLQILTAVSGMNVAAVYNRTLAVAEKAFNQAGVGSVKSVDNLNSLEDAIKKGQPAVTDNAELLCEAEGIDAIVEVTGEVEFGARVVMKAIENNKHVILANGLSPEISRSTAPSPN